jgi:hypothetical protein
MNNFFRKTFVLLLTIFVSTMWGQYLTPADSNMTLLGREPNGYCNVVMPFNSTYLLAGSGRGVRIIDYSDKQHPVMIGQIKTEADVSGIAVNGNYAYIATDSPYGAFSEGFYVVDLSDISGPIIDYYESFSNTGGAFAIVNNGNYVFVATNGRVYIYDATNPTSPQKLSSVGVSNAPDGLYFADNKLYVTAQSSGMIIVDVSDPAKPVKLGTYNKWAEKCAVRDTLAFLVDQSGKLQIISVADPANPYLVSVLPQDSSFNSERFWDVKTKGNIAYASGDVYVQNKGQSAYLKVVDISNPSNPKTLNKFVNPPNHKSAETGLSIQLLDNDCFIAIENGFEEFDITSVNNIKLLSEYYTFRYEGKVKLFNNYVVIAYKTNCDSVNGFTIYDVSEPERITEKSNTFIKSYGGFFDFAIDGNTLCISERVPHGGLKDTLSSIRFFNIASPSSPQQIGIVRPALDLISPVVAFHNNLLCCLDRDKENTGDSLRIVDVSDNKNPKDIGGYHVDFWKEGAGVKQMEFAGDYLALGNTKGLLILNLATPTNPTFSDFIQYKNDDYDCYGMKIKGSSVYMAHFDGFEIFNISNPSNITRTFYYNPAGIYLRDVDFYNGDIYVADFNGVKIYSPDSDSTATLQGYYDTKFGPAYSLVVNNGNVYAAYYGLHIFKKGISSDVEHGEGITPISFKLCQNYPNPFNPTTTIKYSIPSVIARSKATKQSNESPTNQQIASPRQGVVRNDVANVTLKVYDILGREVATLVNQKQAPGNYSVKFNASQLSSGVYFYRLKAGNLVQTKKMILMK